MLTFFDKAIVSFIMPGLVPAIIGALSSFGVTQTMNWETALSMVLTGGIVYLVPGFGKTIAAFLVPTIVSSVASFAKGFGISPTMGLVAAITAAVTGVITHMVPNKTA